METSSFVLRNVPPIEDEEDYLIDFVEIAVEEDVKHVQPHLQKSDTFLVHFVNSLDVTTTVNKIVESPWEDQHLTAEPVSSIKNVIIVEGTDIVKKLSLFFLKLYFQSKFGSDEEIVTDCLAIPNTELVVVFFKDSQVTSEILKTPIHVPLPHVGLEIKVEPYYSNFHGCYFFGNEPSLHEVVMDRLLGINSMSAYQHIEWKEQHHFEHFQGKDEEDTYKPYFSEVKETQFRPDSGKAIKFEYENYVGNASDVQHVGKFSTIGKENHNEDHGSKKSDVQHCGRFSGPKKGHQNEKHGSKVSHIGYGKHFSTVEKQNQQYHHGNKGRDVECDDEHFSTVEKQNQQYHHGNKGRDVECDDEHFSTVEKQNQQYHHGNKGRDVECDDEHFSTVEKQNQHKHCQGKKEDVEYENDNFRQSKTDNENPQDISGKSQGIISALQMFMSYFKPSNKDHKSQESPMELTSSPSTSSLNISTSSHHSVSSSSTLSHSLSMPSQTLLYPASYQHCDINNDHPSDHELQAHQFFSMSTISGQSDESESEYANIEEVGKTERENDSNSNHNQVKCRNTSFHTETNSNADQGDTDSKASPYDNVDSQHQSQVKRDGLCRHSESEIQIVGRPFRRSQYQERKSSHEHQLELDFDGKNKLETSGSRTNSLSCSLPVKMERHIQKHHWQILKSSIRSLRLSNNYYDHEKEIFTFESNNTAESESSILELEADIIKISEKMPEIMTQVFGTKHGKKFIKHFSVSELSDFDDVTVHIEGNCLVYHGLHQDTIEKVKQKVKDELCYSVKINVEIDSLLQDMKKKKEAFENQYKVCISLGDQSIGICGVHDDVNIVKNLIEEFIEEGKIERKVFEFSGDYATYVKQICDKELNEIMKMVKCTFDITKDKFIIKYSGLLREVEKVTSLLDNILQSLKSEQIDVMKDFSKNNSELLLKELSLLSPDCPLQTMQELFMSQKNCAIMNVVDEEPSVRLSLSPLPRDSKRDSFHATSSKSYVQRKQEALFALNSSMQLKIKLKGDIVWERSDILVCALPENRQLKGTNISKSFLHMISNLQSTVDGLLFSPGGVALTQISGSRMKCKAIVFVTLMPSGPNLAMDYLKDCILEALIEGAKFGAKSVSFPPIGLGRVMRYQESIIADQFFSAVNDFMSNHANQCQIQKIKFLASSRQLYQCLERNGKNSYKKIMKSKEMKTDSQTESLSFADSEEVRKDNACSDVKNAQIRIVHRQSGPLASIWKDRLKDYIDHEDVLETKFEKPSTSLAKQIDEKLKRLPLLLSVIKSKSGHYTFKIKGSQMYIKEMKAFIAQEIINEGLGGIQKSPSTVVPRRHTLQFLKYAAALDITVPSYWKHKIGSQSFLERVNSQTEKAIENLLLSTWNTGLVGQGADAINIPANSMLKLVSVRRVENPSKYIVYAADRKAKLHEKADEGQLCQRIKQISTQGLEVSTYDHLPNFMKEELYTEINEHYLFHGTKGDTANSIIKQGCYPNLANPLAMFGKGVYTAESSTKADQYTDEVRNRLPADADHYMFLVRMVLGDVFLCDSSHPSVKLKNSAKLLRPPCKRCQKDKCNCGENFDSVLGEGQWLFREFVVYQHNQCYPEYLIQYKRAPRF